MGSSNRSPSYLKDRTFARWWLKHTAAGKLAEDYLRKHSRTPGDASYLLDDDSGTAWDDLIQGHKEDAILAASNKEAREAFELARKSSSINKGPLNKQNWRRTGAIPLDHWVRRIADSGDPDYWSNKRNYYRELLENPEWATVPLDYIRAALEEVSPKPSFTRIIGG